MYSHSRPRFLFYLPNNLGLIKTRYTLPRGTVDLSLRLLAFLCVAALSYRIWRVGYLVRRVYLFHFCFYWCVRPSIVSYHVHSLDSVWSDTELAFSASLVYLFPTPLCTVSSQTVSGTRHTAECGWVLLLSVFLKFSMTAACLHQFIPFAFVAIRVIVEVAILFFPFLFMCLFMQSNIFRLREQADS